MADERASPDGGPESEFSRPFKLVDLADGGIEQHLEATAAERRGLAVWLGLAKLNLLEADVELTPWRRDGMRLHGRLRAEVEQICVVTLDPLQRIYEHAFERTFLPAQPVAMTSVAETVIDIDADEPPDPVENGIVDLGVVLAEELALVIDPYPRKDGVSVDSEAVAETDTSVNPFARLIALKKRLETDGTDT